MPEVPISCGPKVPSGGLWLIYLVIPMSRVLKVLKIRKIIGRLDVNCGDDIYEITQTECMTDGLN